MERIPLPLFLIFSIISQGPTSLNIILLVYCPSGFPNPKSFKLVLFLIREKNQESKNEFTTEDEHTQEKEFN